MVSCGVGKSGKEQKAGRADLLPVLNRPPAIGAALKRFGLRRLVAQLTVIAAATLLFAYWFRERFWYHARFVVPASLTIAMIGLFWTVQRVTAG